MPVPTSFGPSHKERKLRNIFGLLQRGGSQQHSGSSVGRASPEKGWKGYRAALPDAAHSWPHCYHRRGKAAPQAATSPYRVETLQLNSDRVWGENTSVSFSVI